VTDSGSVSAVRSVVIVGGGMAGVAAARELRAKGFDGAISIIDSAGLPYDRPPLSKDFLLGTTTADALLLALPSWYETESVTPVTGHTAVSVDPGSPTAPATVTLDDGEVIAADAVILTTGATARRLPINDSGAENVHVLRTIDDAVRLRGRLGAGTRLFIVGAGLIGAEVASTASALGAQVTLIDPVSPPLGRIVGDDLATFLHEHHARNGIRSIHGTVAEFLTDAAGNCSGARLDSGELVEFDELLIGIGIVPSTGLAESAGLDVDNGILVDEWGRTSSPRVFAAGDVARVRLASGELLPRTEHWEAARVDGIAVASAVLGDSIEREPHDWFWSDRQGLHLEVVGSLTADGETVLRGEWGDEPFALFRVSEGRLVGAASVNDSMAVRAARRLIDLGIPVDAATLADPATSLRKLVRS
jgi:NADPH-dependent 2,4-dienoyl-CoA reductase/sulfur reductase-like enzyme